MEEVRSSSLRSSTSNLVVAGSLATSFLCNLATAMRCASFALAGFVAGEGSFYVTSAGADRVDGSSRIRFVFQVTIAQHDLHLLHALRSLLSDTGYIAAITQKNRRWLPLATYKATSRIGIRDHVIPFFDQYLLASAKREQFDRWRGDFERYEREHPTQWGRGPSACSQPGCNKPVRGRGLCRSHYYRATGY